MVPSRKLQAECRKLKIWVRIYLVAFSRNYSTEELQIPTCTYCYFSHWLEIKFNKKPLICSILPVCRLLTEGKMHNQEHRVTCQRHRCPPDWTWPRAVPFTLHACFLTEVQLWQVIKLHRGGANFSQPLSSGDRDPSKVISACEPMLLWSTGAA